jgi:hypothetical protein
MGASGRRGATRVLKYSSSDLGHRRCEHATAGRSSQLSCFNRQDRQPLRGERQGGAVLSMSTARTRSAGKNGSIHTVYLLS